MNFLLKTRKIGSLNSFEIEKLVSHLKSWEISITGTKGWKEAQVTAGGIDLDEINLDTMESKAGFKSILRRRSSECASMNDAADIICSGHGLWDVAESGGKRNKR